MNKRRDIYLEDVAMEVLLNGLQSWGQSEGEQIETWQLACDFMDLDVKVSIEEREGGQRFFSINGPKAEDVEKAKMFMNEVTGRFPNGKVEAEKAMIEGCLEKYRK
jgi:hypothetical protein